MARRIPERLLAAALVWLVCAAAAQPAAPQFSQLPQPRPGSLKALPPEKLFSAAGSVCGVAAIKGVPLKRFSERSGCGIEQPVRVTSVSGVRLKPAAVIDCAAAQALNTWVDNTAEPAFGDLGGGLAELEVAGGYSCRTRNNQPGAKLSEHAQGKAVDISGFRLRNGRSVSVLKGWSNSSHGPALALAHKSACDSFGTVLGPESDRFHRDHFHLDTEQHYDGTYCR